MSFRIQFPPVTLTLLLTLCSGCAAVRNCKYELNQRAYTAIAWADYDSDKNFCIVSSHSTDFQCGWKAGFYSVITGGECRPPVVPPKKYWQSPLLFTCNETGCKDWYDGFRCGANAARHQPDEHYIKPWFSTSCEPCQTCDSCLVNAASPVISGPAIKLLGIAPLESAETANSQEWRRPTEQVGTSAAHAGPAESQDASEDTPPASGTKELTPQPEPLLSPRMEND